MDFLVVMIVCFLFRLFAFWLIVYLLIAFWLIVCYEYRWFKVIIVIKRRRLN